MKEKREKKSAQDRSRQNQAQCEKAVRAVVLTSAHTYTPSSATNSYFKVLFYFMPYHVSVISNLKTRTDVLWTPRTINNKWFMWS